MPNAITDAAAMLQQKGALAYQIRELAKTPDDKWSAETTEKFDKLNAELSELERKLDRVDEERQTQVERKKERDIVADIVSISEDEQASIYRDWADFALREYLAFGEVRSDRGRKAVSDTGRMMRAVAARSIDPERRDQNIGTPADGGYLTHPEFSNELARQLQSYIGVSRVARILTTSTGSALYWPTTGIDLGEKIDEAAAQTADTGADIAFGQKVLNAYKYSSKVVRVSRELLMDSLLPIEAIVMQRLAERLGRIIEQEATTGDGSGDPNGFVTAAPVGHEVATADAPGGNATVPTASDLIDLMYSVDAAYRTGSSVAWLAHDSMWGFIRKLDDSTNNLLWQPSLQLGQPDRLMGFPVITANNMLAASAVDANNEKFMVFGDFSYFIMRFVRGIHMQRLNELYAANDQIGFFAVQRFDSELVHGGAAGTAPIKALSTTVA
jgi:HK97 family phage major capsid protein